MTKEEILANTQLFLLDLDGTVYRDETLIGDMKNTLKKLKAVGKKVIGLTNNSSKSAREYHEKLDRLGISAMIDGVMTSGIAALDYVKSLGAGTRVHLLATDGVKREFQEAGVLLVDENPDVCVLALDTEITFGKIRLFNKLLVGGAKFVATHPDNKCPTEDVSMPDVGSFIKLFEHSSERKVDLVCGKPFTLMSEQVIREYGVPAETICMVGDRISTDILFGKNCGMMTLLVLSGDTTEEILNGSDIVPDLVLPTLNELL